MEFDDIVLPMNLLGTDEKTGKLLCSIKVKLGGGPGGLAMRAESANMWHRRMGHINRKSMSCGECRAVESTTTETQVFDVCAVD